MVSEHLLAEINENKSVNRFHSILLIMAMTAMLSLVGFLTLGISGFVISILFTIFAAFFGQRISTAWIMRSYKAREIGPAQAPGVHAAFVKLAKEAGLSPLPKLFYIPSRMPNAFATGHKNTAAVAITDGILRMMNPREINGILAHEIAHLMHRDTKVMALADTMSRLAATASRIGFLMCLFSCLDGLLSGGFISYFLGAFLILFFSPTVMILLQLALSRSREFNADLGAVQLTGDAIGLSSALHKLERLSKGGGFWKKILQPGPKRAQPALLRTHPPTDERIKRLMEHADEAEVAQIAESRRRPVRSPEQRRVVVQVPRVRRRPSYRLSSGLWH